MIDSLILHVIVNKQLYKKFCEIRNLTNQITCLLLVYLQNWVCVQIMNELIKLQEM